MSLHFSDIFAKIQELVATDRSVSACMSEIIGICWRDVPHSDWSRLSALDYDGDVASLTLWIPGVFKREPAPFPIQGLWFGLTNPTENSNVWADMYVGSVGQYEPADTELGWIWKKGKRHYPEDSYAHSSSLRSIYKIAYAGSGGLSNDAEWPLCLAFAAFAVRSLLRGQTVGLVASTAPRIGVAVGFDSGDMLKIGELTETGLMICTT